MIIYQNDQYYIKVRPTLNGNVVDNDCDELVIKVGEVVKKKSLNEISFDNTLKCWLFPLIIEQSSNFNYDVKIQSWFSYGDNYFSTPVRKLEINSSIIKKSEVIDDD
ncbi:MAG: hypothetical protein IJH31_01855 [Erysipelotrichaceae bacterium]|nr:hypothetical protein [Erysipelotrichaceae bacterium]